MVACPQWIFSIYLLAAKVSYLYSFQDKSDLASNENTHQSEIKTENYSDHLLETTEFYFKDEHEDKSTKGM